MKFFWLTFLLIGFCSSLNADISDYCILADTEGELCLATATGVVYHYEKDENTQQTVLKKVEVYDSAEGTYKEAHSLNRYKAIAEELNKRVKASTKEFMGDKRKNCEGTVSLINGKKCRIDKPNSIHEKRTRAAVGFANFINISAELTKQVIPKNYEGLIKSVYLNRSTCSSTILMSQGHSCELSPTNIQHGVTIIDSAHDKINEVPETPESDNPRNSFEM